MSEVLSSALYFGLVISVVTYLFGIWVKNKTKLALFNPLLVSVVLIILFLVVFKIDYAEYNRGASYISYFLTPATVCLAIPLCNSDRGQHYNNRTFREHNSRNRI